MSFQLTANALDYAWRQLGWRAGLSGDSLPGEVFGHLGIPLQYATADSASLDTPSIVVVPCAGSAWHALLERAPNSLHWLQPSDVLPSGVHGSVGSSIPVLFWGEGYEDGSWPFCWLRPDGSLVFGVDIIATTLFMLTRWEETVTSTCDEHGRFPATASVAHKQGFLDRPIVDEYALILREWLKVLLPGWEPEPRLFSVKLSHDVDKIRRLARWLPAAMTLGGDLLKRRSLTTALRTASGWAIPSCDPYLQGIQALVQVSEEHGLGDDAFNFMAAEPSSRDNDYDLAMPRVKKCVESLRERGFEIGFHASYHTLNDPGRLALEKARFDELTGETQAGGRQHFLRFQVPDTWRDWEKVGLAYDSSMTYADCEGFRCGTCHPFHPFDVEQDRELALWEQPLIVMDGTLRDYRALTPEQGETRILELARHCRRVEGTFTLLWHNSSLDGDWRPWGDVYQRVVRELAEMQGGGGGHSIVAGPKGAPMLDHSHEVGRSSSHFRMGVIYQRYLDPPHLEDALAAYQQALAAGDSGSRRETAWVHARLGQVYYALDRDAGTAELQMLKALDLASEDKWLWVVLGDLYLQEGREGQATAMYEQALDIDPNFKGSQKRLDALRE